VQIAPPPRVCSWENPVKDINSLKIAKLACLVSISAAACFIVCPTAWCQLPPVPTAVPNGPSPVLQEGIVVNYTGSVATGTVSATPLDLTLRDAIQRGLRYNLGVLTNRDITDVVRAERRRTLSALLPNLSAGFSQAEAQNSLVAFGFAGTIPGIPPVVGPFHYENVRAYLQQTVYDRPSLKNLQSANESEKAASLTAEDARNLVVQAVSNAYLAVITDASLVVAIQAELDTAQALYKRAQDQKAAGTVPAIDVLRAQLQYQTEQQRLVAETNQVQKDKLVLARTIGLPEAQTFNVTDVLPFAPLDADLGDVLKQALDRRPDFRAAQANVRAAQFAIEAARGQRWPSFVLQADYGDIGKTLFTDAHGTFSILGGVKVPIYAGGHTRTDIDQAEVILRNKKNAVEDLRGRIEFEIRTALLDLKSAADQVTVARANVDLANETVIEARDRFSAGVTDNIEVIQAQQLLADANQNYISSLNAHNQAKISLATALGQAEVTVPQYLNLKP
jgi:outer membrane protein TolC